MRDRKRERKIKREVTDQITQSMMDWSSDDDFRGFTENNSATHLSSGNPCLDFFFHVVPDTLRESVINRLELAWNHDPLTTLKLVCNLRAIRCTGKSDKESFYTAALWIHKHHPKTLAANVALLAEFGCFKDLLEILCMLLEGRYVRENAKFEWYMKKSVKGKGERRKKYFLLKKKQNQNKKRNSNNKKRRLRARVPREERIEANRAQMKAEQERAKVARKEKRSAMAEKATERYNSDPDYKLFHDQVSSFFAVCLTLDIESLNSGDSKKISLAAKSCPSVDSSYDNATLICQSIAAIIYPRNSDPEFDGLDEANYVFKIKNRLTKQILVPLRKALQLPEVYMSAKQWSSLPYDRVASVAMKNYTDIFLHRDKVRFREYLQNVATGDDHGGGGASLVADLQWKRMVDDLSAKGKLTNCIAVCDVSGSMAGTPMEVSVALGLLVSELTSEPWKGHVITFSRTPELHLIQGRDLRSKTDFIRKMDWGGNTDFQKVFDRMLEVAVKRKLWEEDMEFDEASGRTGQWETDYEVIERKFKRSGYSKVPEIVFWNLRDSKSTPVTANKKGVALLSGFSKNLLTLFLEEGGVIKPKEKGRSNPEDRMEAAISGELYQDWLCVIN